MPVEFKDYYEVLGIARTANQGEIRKAFRTLARLHHPDVAKNKKVAEDKFKEINEANEVLSEPEKRRKYDELGANWYHPERQAAQPQGGFKRNAANGSEFHFEGTGFSDFFEQFFGGQSSPFTDTARTGAKDATDPSYAQRGMDVEGDILVTLDEVLHGSTRTIQLQRTDPGTGRSNLEMLRVKIPPGVRQAQRIRVSGKGQEGMGGGDAGHLYMRVTFAKHPDLQVRGEHLYYDLKLAPWEAVLGATIPVPTLEGIVSMKVPPCMAASQELRLRDKGLPGPNGVRGDLHAVVSIEVPTQLSSEQKILWEQLAKASPFNPRKNA